MARLRFHEVLILDIIISQNVIFPAHNAQSRPQIARNALGRIETHRPLAVVLMAIRRVGARTAHVKKKLHFCSLIYIKIYISSHSIK